MRRVWWTPTVVTAVSVIAAACSGPGPTSTTKTPATRAGAAAPEGPEYGSWGFDRAGMDTSVKPGDDFYRYANGGWTAKAEIAPDKTDTGPIPALTQRALDQVKALLEEAAAQNAPKGSDTQKIGDWFASMMDEDKLAADGLTPLQADRDRIKAVNDRTGLADLLADNLAGVGAAPLATYSEFDKAHQRKTLVAVAAGGMSLPARDMYLKPEYAAIRQLFSEHVARVLALAGMDHADERAARVLALETEIARVSLPLEEMRDPRKLFNPTPAGDLPKVAPGIDWPRFLERSGVGSPAIVDVMNTQTIVGVTRLIAQAPLETWRDYCEYSLIRGAADALPTPVRDEFFGLYGKALGGQPTPTPRWMVVLRGMGWEGQPLQDAIGQQFIARYVQDDTRPQAREMVDNLVKAFDARLAKLEWMTPETRAAARDKLAKTTIKVVYPDHWEGTDGLEVVRGDAVGNLRRGLAFTRRRNLSELASYPDTRKFIKPVFQVNAYANPSWNEIVFLAAIIRPPFFDPEAEPVVNYGAMGAAIGHEVSHLFDDQGRLYDADGLLRDWWKPEDARQFIAVASRLEQQVSGYETLPGKPVNGKLTLGESIADVAGLAVAYDAYRLSLNGQELPVVDGFTGDQRFFLGYAQAWRWKAREAYRDRLREIDFHPPSDIRPQTVRNIDAWYTAFNVQSGDKLYLAPAQRVRIW